MPSRPARWLALVLPLACAPAAPPEAPVSRGLTEERTEVTLVTPVLPAFPWVADREADGTLDVLAGAWRATVKGEAVTLASDAPASHVRRATRIVGGWLFVGKDGLVTRSDTFAGPLRRVGEIPRGVARGTGSQGRAAVVDDHDELWTSDGGAPTL